jgi:hypothetical protein
MGGEDNIIQYENNQNVKVKRQQKFIDNEEDGESDGGASNFTLSSQTDFTLADVQVNESVDGKFLNSERSSDSGSYSNNSSESGSGDYTEVSVQTDYE